MQDDNKSEHDDTEGAAFATVIAGTAFLAAVAVGLSLLFKTPLGPQVTLDFNDMLLGVIFTLPLAIFLWWFSNSNIEPLVAFRESQIEFFSKLDFSFTPVRIVLMAIGAGVSEELLFRGVLQTWLASLGPLLVAIIASNIVFGLLHWRTWMYAVIAGCVGVYLGIIYALTDNLLTPIVTHMLYDAVALEYTRRAIAAYRA